MKTVSVSVVDTGVANIASMLAALKRIGADPALTLDLAVVRDHAIPLVLPGVGTFGAAMRKLRQAGLVEALKERFESGAPSLGVCVGMQLLCAGSEESQQEPGLSVISAQIEKFPASVRVPQFGWNLVKADPSCQLLSTGYAYFANSFRLAYAPAGWQSATAEHGGAFVAAIEKGAVMACQFHPELSSSFGLGCMQRWLTRAEVKTAQEPNRITRGPKTC